MRHIGGIVAMLLVLVGTTESHGTLFGDNTKAQHKRRGAMNSTTVDTATFAAGCFWCVEAIFQNLKGVRSIVSGYSGGHVPNPNYKQVCTDTTGHAEACQIAFDPKEISYAELLEVFWKVHDPTTLNRQGNDEGTQYRSAIFYHNDEQRTLAEHYKKELDASGAFNAPIVTEIVPFTNFFKAEDYHQNYFNENGNQPYCKFVIQPKVEKFKAVFKTKLKEAH
ncbi:MAG: peptide-methionine (S)-S-oxide reductase MsrA [Ignavibacteriae bacterium]|nr:peptide-methionine (S)-S-oxide reductase MsrA [Ignavibacteria bacterium]MBI3365019.1 peptide-methionine (S)-S-oxide reductase MsrA [Ignavibacteriota bacterium]